MALNSSVESTLSRVCSKCGLEKNIEEFRKSAKNVGGRRRDCKACQRHNRLNPVSWAGKESTVPHYLKPNPQWRELTDQKKQIIRRECISACNALGAQQHLDDVIQICMIVASRGSFYHARNELIALIKSLYGNTKEEQQQTLHYEPIDAILAEPINDNALAPDTSLEQKTLSEKLLDLIKKEYWPDVSSANKWAKVSQPRHPTVYMLVTMYGMNRREVAELLNITEGFVNGILKEVKDFIELKISTGEIDA